MAKLFTFPEKLSIAFPIWALHDTPPGGVYADPDRFVREHAERGFNCIRFDDGAGLIHDATGNLRRQIPLSDPYPGFSRIIRQLWKTGNGGNCDLWGRLIRILEAAKKYNVYVILSSWYYLHTYWFLDDEKRNKELFNLPVHDRFRYFAEELDRILTGIRQHGLIDRIAAAEIMNEADGLFYINGYAERSLPAEEITRFREDHEQALQFLQERHPDVFFAYDSYTPYTDVNQIPRNAQLWNFHFYSLWDIYSVLESNLLNSDADTGKQRNQLSYFLKKDAPSLEKVAACRNGRLPADQGWIRRVWIYNSLDPQKIPELEKSLADTLEKDYTKYQEKLKAGLRVALQTRNSILPGVPMIIGEGITYCGSDLLQWEENDPRYWNFVEFALRSYREAGIAGSVIRTCCGPEDPCWEKNKAMLLRLNRIFQGKED